MLRSAFLALGLVACGPRSEGTASGDCRDGADNDGDGLFDCDDEGCAGSPDCEEADTDADTDSDTDTDTDTDADTDTDTDTDSDVDTDTDVDTGPTDADGDGWTIADGDCDDGNPDVHPGAEEICENGIDDDCDGTGSPCELAGILDLSVADAKLLGEHTGDRAGTAVASGDVDGDGIDDLLVGAEYEGTGGAYAGAAYLVLGPLEGTTSLSSAEAKLVGEDLYDGAGCAVATGDIDGDGFADLLVGAKQVSTRADREGAAYVVRGPTSGTTDLSLADTRLLGEDELDFAGGAVAAGDVNDDGLDDLLIGAEGESTGASFAGAAYLVLGPAGGTTVLSAAAAKFLGEGVEDYAGGQVAVGDVDADGVADVLIAAEDNDEGGDTAGAVYVVHGPVTGTLDLADADAKLLGQAGDCAWAPVAAGDMDGDGIGDIVVGAPCHDGPERNSGAAYVLFGPAAGTVELAHADARFEGDSGDKVGMAVASGDLDGDGAVDLFAGSHDGPDAEWAGAVYVVYGPVAGTMVASDADAKLLGEVTGEYAGSSLTLGDTDGDERIDLVVGTWADAAYVLRGGGM